MSAWRHVGCDISPSCLYSRRADHGHACLSVRICGPTVCHGRSSSHLQGSPRAEGTDRARASTVEKLEVKLAAKIEELDLGAVSQLLAAAERMGLPQSNTVVELGRALVYLNSLANEVSYACRFRQVEILPRALDAIACVAPGTSEGQEVELDERTSEQYRRAQHAIEAAQLDLQASVAIELGDTERMEEIEAQAQQDGHHQVAARVRAGRQLEETKATVRVWLEEKEEEARRARQARIDKKREQKRAEVRCGGGGCRARRSRSFLCGGAEQGCRSWLACAVVLLVTVGRADLSHANIFFSSARRRKSSQRGESATKLLSRRG